MTFGLPNQRAGIFLVALVLVIALGIGAWANLHRAAAPPPPPALPILGTLPDFRLVDQDARPVTRADLRGHACILDFIYTECGDVCPVMTEVLARVRRGLGARSEVRTLSVTVDPEQDRPAVLRQFARAHGAADPRWQFLTGDGHAIMRMMVALRLASAADGEVPNPLLHSQRFVLLDGRGRVRGYYMFDDPDSRLDLLQDARSLEAAATRP